MSRRRFRFFVGLVAAILALSVGQVVWAAVKTDQADYAPGSVVTISGDNSDGAGYVPGETVDVAVSGPNGYTASCQATTGEDGSWSCTITLNADDSAIGDYSYTATSASGVQQSGVFSDSNDNKDDPSSNPGQAGTTLTAYKTATGHFTRTYSWTIDKSVTPDTLDMFTGDSGDVEYTITVDKSDPEDAVWVDGEVCVTNGGGVATEGLSITDNLLYKTGAGQFQVLTSVAVDLGINPVLDPGESQCYPYSISFAAVPGASYKNDAVISITNHSGHLGEPFGPSPDADFSLPEPTVINDSINVDDSNGGSWPFSDDGQVQYDKTFTCDADEGSHGNTATIRETGQSDDANVTVNCYALGVTKDATTSFDRAWTWTVEKTADTSAVTLSTGQTWLVNYSVVVNATSTDSNWAVAGNIYVNNPAPMAAKLLSVNDLLSADGAVAVDCGVVFPYDLAAGETLHCTYSMPLPDADAQVNTAAATIQNNPGGTTSFTGSANVAFSTTPTNETDECASVSDTYAGDLGVVCAGVDTLPKTYTYTRDVGSQSVCGRYEMNNTATTTTNDTGATDTATHTVVVTVPCGGCSLTPGYWKTHSSYGPAPYDDTWAQLPNGADTPFFLSGQTYYQVLWTAPQGNAYYILAHAYIAAYLNQLNGANTAAVTTQLSAAANLLNTYTPAQVAGLKGAAKNNWTSLATILDNYNNGLIGPGHCSE